MSITVEQVKAYRDRHGVDLHRARLELEREDRFGRLVWVETMLTHGAMGEGAGLLEIIAILKEMNN